MVGKRFADLGGVPGEDDDEPVVKRAGTRVEEHAEETTAAPVCRCDRTGFVTVVTDAATGDYLGANANDYPGRQVNESVYPCAVCKPAQFLRWRAGCYTQTHDPKKCSYCVEAGDDRRRARYG